MKRLTDTDTDTERITPPKAQPLPRYDRTTDRYDDPRLKALARTLGCRGLAVWDYVECLIYRQGGYFLAWDGKDCRTALDVADALGVNSGLVAETLRYCAAAGLLDAALLRRGIITSADIQRHWKTTARRLHRGDLAPDPSVALIGDVKVSTDPATLILDDEWTAAAAKALGSTRRHVRRLIGNFAAHHLASARRRHDDPDELRAHAYAWLKGALATERKNRRVAELITNRNERTLFNYDDNRKTDKRAAGNRYERTPVLPPGPSPDDATF